MTILCPNRQRSMLTRRTAVCRASNELAGEQTQNEVVVLDREHGSCRGSIRCEPSEATTFFVRSHGQRKVIMSRHEALVGNQIIRIGLTASEISALERWSDEFLDDKTLRPEMAHIAISYALLHPQSFARWMDIQAEYCEAEQLTATEHARSQVAATYANLEELP
jgi:hypothetical protein